MIRVRQCRSVAVTEVPEPVGWLACGGIVELDGQRGHPGSDVCSEVRYRWGQHIDVINLGLGVLAVSIACR
ncbi:hypothetical protein DSECCO2_590410 [anaerobic digester metagenome]